jgi:hypothetical protein
MFRWATVLIVAGALFAPGFALAAATQRSSAAPQPSIYFPERNDWQHKKPEDVGMDSARLDQAVKSAIANENPLTKDMAFYLATTFGAREPLDTPIGPIKDRGPANGVITRHGYVASIKTPTQKDALAK